MPNKHFLTLIEECKQIHEKKLHDYAQDDNPFSNFERASDIANGTVNDIFKVMIGIKIARLEELLENDKQPLNESIKDSFIDLANYCLLWGAYHLSLTEKNNV